MLTPALTIINTELVSQISGNSLKNNIAKWFSELSNANCITGNKFLICLSIDLKHKLLPISVFENIFCDLDFSKPPLDVLNEMDVNIHNNLPKYFSHSNCESCNYPPTQYVSIRTFSKIFDKFLQYKNATGFYTYLPDDEEWVYEELISNKSIDLEHVKEWAGWKNLTWILSQDDFNSISAEGASLGNKLKHLIDTLGLEPPKKIKMNGEVDNYLAIDFPSDFQDITFQPTTLCGFWKEDGGLYMSYVNKDGFGRTASTEGRVNPKTNYLYGAKERVINSTDYGNATFIINELDSIHLNFTKNDIALINEGLKRLLL